MPVVARGRQGEQKTKTKNQIFLRRASLSGCLGPGQTLANLGWLEKRPTPPPWVATGVQGSPNEVHFTGGGGNRVQKRRPCKKKKPQRCPQQTSQSVGPCSELGDHFVLPWPGLAPTGTKPVAVQHFPSRKLISKIKKVSVQPSWSQVNTAFKKDQAIGMEHKYLKNYRQGST